MCRWLAYSGEPIQPSTLILDAKHSLVAQSLNSPLGAETVNGDGFGFGWYPRDNRTGGIPAIFHSIEPAWHDENLREITHAVESPLFFAHVRAAGGPPIQQTNCHPFRYENWLFMHNGFLSGFTAMKRDLTFAVDPSLYPLIHGTTDSEVLFHLALTLGLRDDPIAGMAAAVRMVESVGRAHGIEFPMQGTVAVSNGKTLWAFRYSTEGRTRTLFHSAEISALRELYPDAERLDVFGSRARVVVSEPLTDLPGAFIEVPEATVAILDESGYEYQPFSPA
ncbi:MULTISPECIES: class II glutamine amidotransferase [unclassified Leifsonia]|uniref:class II glutamine amidotransferase n=1 Tax=unclassified Leifsonia TaxID=2663824 RepID=UPI0006F6DC80|nr:MULTISPECIES: class II glutamine amidotransferase [unclassified Leifsonia]KQX05757.1 glutamine amidotransferase [Leifsonia sp. Root1293]KRA09393.1 glutamine amidotransferase [Leifsonia sp. Root60]